MSKRGSAVAYGLQRIFCNMGVDEEMHRDISHPDIKREDEKQRGGRT